MPMKQTGRKVYKSMQGKTVDMDLLRQRNELTPAVGNARVNARGDELGPGGKILRKREDVLKEYYQNSKGVPEEAAVSRKPAPAPTPAPTVATKKVEPKEEVKPVVEKDLTDDWVEDEDGNFVPAGE